MTALIITLSVIAVVYGAYRILKYKIDKSLEGDWFKDIDL